MKVKQNRCTSCVTRAVLDAWANASLVTGRAGTQVTQDGKEETLSPERLQGCMNGLGMAHGPCGPSWLKADMGNVTDDSFHPLSRIIGEALRLTIRNNSLQLSQLLCIVRTAASNTAVRSHRQDRRCNVLKRVVLIMKQ